MEAVDGRGMGILKFFLVSVSRKWVLREFLDLFNDDTPGFGGEPLQELPCPSLDQNGKHAFPLPIPQSSCRISSGSKATNSPLSSISTIIFQSR